jgi:hypothetical protein
MPALLPGQCEGEATGGLSPITGNIEELQPFSNWSPRMSLTYDLFGNGKTALKATGSYYYATKITLANSLSGLGTVTLTWGTNANSGACSTAANASCWNDANRDGFIQPSELSGNPSTNTSRFDTTTGKLTAAGNAVDKSAKLARTREFTGGISHELISNLAVGADYIYRKYDLGTASYVIGYQPGAEGFPLSQIYTPAT